MSGVWSHESSYSFESDRLTHSIDFWFRQDQVWQFSSVQLEMVSMRSEKPLCALPSLLEVSTTSPLKQFQCLSDWRCPSLVLSRKIVSRFLFPSLSPPGDWWCDVLRFVPAGSVSSSSTLHIFREARYLWGLLCPRSGQVDRFISVCVCVIWHQPTMNRNSKYWTQRRKHSI